MRNKKLIIAIACTVCLGGCAQKVWVKEGITQQDFLADRYSCEKDARQSGYFGSGVVGAINMVSFFDECINAHGYELRDANARVHSRYENANPRACLKTRGNMILNGEGRYIGDFKEGTPLPPDCDSLSQV